MATEQATRSCRNCGRVLSRAEDIAWECECGIRVCEDPDCFAEWFKRVGDGETVRCLTCGSLH